MAKRIDAPETAELITQNIREERTMNVLSRVTIGSLEDERTEILAVVARMIVTELEKRSHQLGTLLARDARNIISALEKLS